jgi:hypothetical protein
MACIIELQGYQNLSRELIPKEVVVLTPTTCNKYLVRPLKNLAEFQRSERTLIGWATNKYHHIKWDSGEVSHSELQQSLIREVQAFDKIYTKGREKALYLSNIIGRPVEDLTTYGCPSVRKYLGPACELHSKPTAHCAETTAKYLAEWIAQHL